jgi:N-acetylmuramoyl-L-alanine amidase
MKKSNIFIAMCFSLITTNAAASDCDSVNVLALNMYHEARGEGLDGMIMVAEVTLNRVEHPSYPNSICGVVYQRRQFSWTHMRRDHTPREEESWETAVILAEEILSGEVETLATGATHFLNPDRVSRMPRWANEFEMVARIGNHNFYRMN